METSDVILIKDEDDVGGCGTDIGERHFVLRVCVQSVFLQMQNLRITFDGSI